MIQGLKESQSRLIETEKVRSLANLASQVAHDIRSPLAALQMAIKDIAILPENERIIIRSATKRINDIANNLINQHNKSQKTKPLILSTDEDTVPELVFVIVDNIISEKRFQYMEKNVNFNLIIEDEAYGLFSKLNPISFKRILSNIIDNAAESISEQGRVSVTLTKNDSELKIDVIDNGCGIPEELLPKILQGGTSIGKNKGSGLGLSHAFSCIKLWNGQCEIKSKINEGTTVSITLPISLPAEWFCTKINIYSNRTIVILDDDDSIHAIWNKRLSSVMPSLGNIKILSFKTSNELIEFVNKNKDIQATYLIDYELAGNVLSGLDLIGQLNISKSATLVTSRYEDLDIRQHCAKLGMQIIPKSYAAYIILDVIYSNPDLIIIDDNEELVKAWKFAGISSNKLVTAFNKIDDFINSKIQFNKETPIYIDSDLGEGVKGEIFAKDLYEKGYQNIYLATGSDKSLFINLPWIKNIVGKTFPF